MIRFASLGSGSRGNALLVQAGRARVLIDCGFGPRELARRLSRLGVVAEQLDAVLVTHEHSDHIGGLGPLVRRHGCPVHLTEGTREALQRRVPLAGALHTVRAGASFEVGALSVHPFAVPHDANEPVQYVVSDGRVRLGVLTDTGHVTDAMVGALDGCEALVLEFNHDAQMLESGPYPYFLKRRIAGSDGHLDNAAAEVLLGRVDRSRLQYVVGAHLSETNNRLELVRAAMARALGGDSAQASIATQGEGSSWLEIG